MKKKQHYIPVFYQRLFSENKKSICKFMVAERKYISEASIKKNGVLDYYYGEDETLENILMDIETKASSILKKIVDTGKIPDKNDDYQFLLLFLIILEARVKKSGDTTNNFTDALMKNMSKIEKTPGHFDFELKTENFKVEQKIPTALNIIVSMQALDVLFDLKCSLIISNTSRNFITSDNPVVRYNFMYNYRNYKQNYGLGNMGIQLFLPISPKHCIYLYDNIIYDSMSSEDGNFYIKKARDIDKLNCLFYMNSYDFLIFDSSVKKNYILNLIRGKKNIKELGNGVYQFGPLIGQGFQGVQKAFSLPLFKINKKFIDISLPVHMAGPIRPHAEEIIEKIKKMDNEIFKK